ncbi:hypothetical protein OH76DRAFT_1484747 [Lentinus brumalis]|uniref:F-box domain-containing protein n=1 Tax=Lentinus brumalis TaxID=2498619 RepID=A0A371D4B9_9APHY|nr:hypothetical protein OH76DRAFT_1484747 [Polyporus brumalis]
MTTVAHTQTADRELDTRCVHNGPIKSRDYIFTALTPSGRHIPSNAPADTREESDLSPAERVFACKELGTQIWGAFAANATKGELFNLLAISKNSFLGLVPEIWRDLGKNIHVLLNLLNLRYFDYGLPRSYLIGNAYLSFVKYNINAIIRSFQLIKMGFYGQHVRKVEVNTVTVTPGTFAFLSTLFHNSSALFCSLVKLEWMEASARNNDLLYVLTPALEHLYIQTFDFPDAQDSSVAFSGWVTRVCQTTATISPDLRYLGIEAYGTLSVKLALDFFQSLHALKVHRIDVETSEELPPAGQMAELTELQLASWSGSSAIFDVMLTVCPSAATTLRRVDLQSLAHLYYPENTDFIYHVEPLLSVPQLEHVVLNFPNHIFRYTDEHLRRMSAAWPNIEKLGLSFECERGSSVPELATLGHVAFHCRRLQSITVPAFVGAWLKDGKYRIDSPPNHPLREIRTQNIEYKIERRHEITVALRRAFQDLVPYYPGYGAYERQREADHALLPPYVLRSRLTAISLRDLEPQFYYT